MPHGRNRNRGGARVDNPGAVMMRIIRYVASQYALQFIIVLCMIVLSVLANVQGTLFMQTLIDDYILPMVESGKADFGPLLAAITRVAGFYAIGVACSLIQSQIMVNVTQGTMNRLRKDLFMHMQDLPIKYFDTHAHGDIMSVYTNDIDSLRQMISQSIPQIFNSIITIVSVLVSMIRLSVPLTGVTLAMVVVMLFVSKNLAGLSGKNFMAQQKNLGEMNGFIEEMMSGQKVVKVFSHEEENMKAFNKKNEELFESANRANRYASIMMPINMQLGNVSYVLVAIIGGVLAINGLTGLTLGKLASFLTFNKSFNQPINQVSQQANFIVQALAGADRIFTLLDEEKEVDEGYVTLVRANIAEDGTITESEKRTGHWAWKHYHKDSDTTTYQELQGAVEFLGVDFGYNDEKMVLHDIKMYANPGQKLAFVGTTGAGKTTITNLINRFYTIQDGKIRYDGININKIKLGDLRRSLGMVLQDTHLFTMSVKDNIRYGKLDATDEEVIAAAKLANADEFIRQLPDGYDTILTGDGANLSQGQRQLLSIARAAIADPPVLILDEATSSIDTRTEKAVQEGMDRLMHGRTTFVIAHRLSTIKNSDCIMVLENGRIIERGSHDELLEEKGKYYQLYTGGTK